MIRRMVKSVKDRWLRSAEKNHNESAEKRREMRFETMEDRILLSADFGIAPQVSPIDTGSLANPEPAIVEADTQYEDAQTAQSLTPADAREISITGLSDFPTNIGNTTPETVITGDNAPREAEKQTLVIVDSSLPDYEDLIQQIPADKTHTLAILDANTNGMDQITNILAEHRNMDTVYILSHGSDGALRLGNSWLDSTDLAHRAEQVKTWGEALSPEGDILLYGCNVAAGEDGISFVEKLAELTGADVAASSDDTGASALGGDWDLEYQQGSVEAPLLIDPSGQFATTYGYLLDDMTGTADADTLTSTADEDDTLTGLSGDDTYLFQDSWGQDTIIEDLDNGSDTLDFSNVTADLIFRISGTDGSVTVTDGTNTVTATNIENLIGGSGNDTFILGDGASLAGTINGWYGDNTLDHGLYTTAVDVDLALGLAMGMGSFSFIQNFAGGTAIDTISGSGGNNIWTIDGDNSGIIGSGNADDTVTFSGFENLTGTEDNEDTFLLKETGNVDGTISGGRDGVDSLLVESGSDALILNPDVTGAGSMDLSGRTIDYEGLEPVIITTGADTVVTAAVINATILDDQLILEDTPGDPGSMTLVSLDPNIRFLQADGSVTDVLSFTTPTESITVNLRAGDDTFTPGSTSFSGILTVNGGTGSDTFNGGDAQNLWALENLYSGTLNTHTAFTGFENLTGGTGDDELRGSGLDNTWIINGIGAGTVNDVLGFTGMEKITGGDDGHDCLIVESGGINYIVALAAGSISLPQRTIDYEGIDPFVDVSAPDAVVIYGTILDDTLILEDAMTPGELTLRSLNPNMRFIDASHPDGTLRLGFAEPATGITVNLNSGDDNFALGSTGFSGTLAINGDEGSDTLTGPDTPNIWEITGDGSGTLNAHAFSGFENLNGGTAADIFRFSTDGSLAGDAGVTGGGGNDTLEGPASEAGNVWTLEGPDAGSLNGNHFSGVGNLVGAGDTKDAFYITSTGDISGSISGGAGGIDGLKIETDGGDMLLVAPGVSGTGNATGFDGSGRNISFSGLEPVVDNADLSNIQINAGQANGQLFLEEDTSNPGTFRLRSQGMNFLTASGITDVLAVGSPLSSLSIAGPDDGELTLSTSMALNNGDLIISADTITVAAGIVLSTRLTDLNGNALTDAGDITFNGRIITIGGNAQLLAGVEEDSTFAAGDILLTAANVAETPWIQVGYDSRDAIVTIGASAILTAGNLTITATAGDTAPEALDDAFLTILENYTLGVLQTLLTDNLSLPLVAMVKNAEARVDIGENAQLIASGNIEISSDATADGTVKAITGGVNPFSAVPILNIFSVAYSQADATAETRIKDNVQISAGGDIYIDSAASAKASATSRTSANLGYFPSNRDAIAISVAVSNSHTTSHAVISQGAVIEAGGNINVTAMGTSENVASAEVGVYENGLAGVSVALGFTNNDIKAEVNGSLTAQGSAIEPVPDPDTGEGDAWGIGIHANLTNKMVTSAVSGLRGEPLIKDALLKGEVAPDLGKIIKGTLQKTRDSNKHTNFFSPDSFLSGMSIAGAVAYAHENSDVTAKVGASGDLKSIQDIVVASTVEDRVQTVAESVIADQSPDPGKTEKDSAISVAVIVGEYDNHATALVESDALLLAGRNIEVDSEITYPFFTEPSEAYSADDLKSPAAIGTLLDQKLGVQSKLFNSWARSVGQGGPLGFGFSWDSMNFTNTAEAVIESGAQINQADPDGPYSDYFTDDQSVTVNAATAMELVDMAGVFDINLQASTIQELKDKGDSLGSWLQLQGAKGDSVGLGGSVLWRQTDNQTIARIEDADIHIGESGTLTVSADSHMTAIGLAQSGSGGKYSINGTVAYIDHDSLTLALLQPGVTVNGGALNITAIDDALFGTLAGSAMKGENIGVGISVAITDLSRTTYAAISAASFDADTGRIISLDPDADPTDNGTSITADGDITITATSTGQIGGFAIAAGQLAESKKEPANEDKKEAGDVSDNADAALEDRNADSNDKKQQGSYGIGISGDAAVSTITDWNRAFINDPGTISADTLTLTAESTTGLISIAGAVLVNTRDNSLGIAGSYGQNTLNSITQAVIRGATLVNVANLRLYAHRNGDIYAFTAGGIGAKKKDTINVAGSVSINDIDTETAAFIEESAIRATGEVEVIALDESEILAIAGAVAYGGKAGIGASVSLNHIKTITSAVISDATVENAELVKLSAVNKNEIESIAGSIGISPNNLGVAGTVAINEINDRDDDEILSVEASIKNTTMPEDAAVGSVQVEAVDASRIFSIAGEMALGKSYGLGAAVAYNVIGNKTNADVDGSVIHAEQTVTVKAASASEIETVSVGVSGGQTLGVSGSVSLNTIKNTTRATLGNQSDISADDGVTLTAADSWTDEADALHVTKIKADAGGFGLAASGGKDSSTSIAVGISFAINEITNSLSAVIDNASMTTENDISVTSTSAVTIDALTIGGAGAVATGSGTDLAFAGAGAGSGNTIENTIEAAVKNNSTINANNNALTLTATDTSTIIADAGGVALAVGTSGNKTAGALSIGASIADNEITNSTSAYIDGGTVAQAGDVTVSAQSTSTIDALTFGGAAAVGASGKATGVALSGAGAGSYNTITNTIEAYVKNVAFPNGAGTMALSAIDSATIISDAIGAAASVGASSSGTGVGLAVGVSIAENDIGNTTDAYIENTAIPEGESAESISISAVAMANIQSLSISATLSVGAAKTTGVALSGGGASSDNYIHTKTHAYAKNAYLETTGDMALQATNTSTVTAKVFTVSASVAAAGDNAVAASIGASLAHNAIGWDADGNYKPQEVTAFLQDTGASIGGSLRLGASSGQTINAVVMAGSVAIAASKGVGVGLAGSGVNAENSISTIVQSYIAGDGTQGILAAEIGLSAWDISVITSDAGAASLAASFAGDTAISLSIGVALADNLIANNIAAYITNADSVRAAGGEIRLEAYETAVVDALAVAASLAVGVSPKGFALSLSGAGADAVNTIANQVNAYVTYSTVETTAPEEGFAEAFADYTATDTASVLHNGDRVLVASEAAGETSSDIYEYIGADDLTSVDLAAQNYSDTAKWRLYGPDIVLNASAVSSISALVGAATASISVGATAAAGAFGVSLAENNIGVIGDYPLLNQVTAYADHSTLISAQDIEIHATSTDVVGAVSFAGAVAVAVSPGGTGISLAGAGAELTNTVSSLVHAYIAESDVEAAGDIDIKAYAYTDIYEAGAEGAAIALSLAPSGVAISVAVSLSENTVANDVRAYISGSSDQLVEAVGDISVTADTVARISDAYALTASVSVGYIAAAGGGIDITNTIDENVDAYISGLTVATQGDVMVHARENAYLNGDATAVTVSIGLGGALGVALLTNQINSDISAHITDATVVSDNTVISADSKAVIGKTTSAGISGGLVSVAANRADADIATLVEAFSSNALLVSSEDISIIASAEKRQ